MDDEPKVRENVALKTKLIKILTNFHNPVVTAEKQ
jgi:hypothetical protein